MSVCRAFVAARGREPNRRIAEASTDPKGVQLRTLRRILSTNASCEFGRRHGFADSSGPATYADAVPVRDYEAFRPYVDRMLAGEERVLTQESPFFFGTTSGTTGQAKHVPVTKSWCRGLSMAMRLWLARAARTHPALFDGRVLSFVGSAEEHLSEGGIPCGSISALTYRRVSALVKRNYVMPDEVAEIEDYDTRYRVAARLMLEANVSAVAIPNPTTLLRLAEVGAQNAETIVAAIHDGSLGGLSTPGTEDRSRLASIERRLQPNPRRARQLERSIEQHGSLLPKHVWSNLKMIGCWLGGSAGVFARKLGAYYGDAALRDLGLRATEATIAVPLSDATAAGALTLHDNFFEFVPEEERGGDHPRTLLAHELEVGQRYYVLLTTRAGLYRYDISDVVEVTEMLGQMPLVKFVHKGADMTNLTGEKLHGDQVAQAACEAMERVGMPVDRVQLIPDTERCGYDVLVETEADEATLETFGVEFDAELARLNVEYAAKRASMRLAGPRLRRMRPGWAQRRQRCDVGRGQRDVQYKWAYVMHQWDDLNRSELFFQPDDPGSTQPCPGYADRSIPTPSASTFDPNSGSS